MKTSKQALRRFLLETQHLNKPAIARNGTRQEELVLEILKQLECIQIDPVSVVSPNQHLVLAARIPGYRPELLYQLLEQHRIFEYFANAASILPMEAFPIFQPTRERHRNRLLPELQKLGPVADEVLRKLEMEGPLPAKAFESAQIVHGYWDNEKATTKATSHALNLLMDMGEIRVVQREGNHRVFDLTHRTVPEHLLQEAAKIDTKAALNAMLDKYLRAYRVFEPSDPRFGWQKLTAGQRRDEINQRVASGQIIPVQVEDVKTEYYILASDREMIAKIEANLKDTAAEETVSFLPPLDNLLWSRKRLIDLFDFYYKWEIYTPVSKRQFGCYTMPILAGDRLIGRLDPRMDKKSSRLHIQLLHFETEFTATDSFLANLYSELRAFAKTFGAASIVIEPQNINIKV